MIRIRIKDKDLFIGPQEFVVGYSKAPEQPQSSARPNLPVRLVPGSSKCGGQYFLSNFYIQILWIQSTFSARIFMNNSSIELST